MENDMHGELDRKTASDGTTATANKSKAFKNK